MRRSLLERAAELLGENALDPRSIAWNKKRAAWARDYQRRCRAEYSSDVMPDHRGCPEGAECEGKDIYWRPA